MNITVTSQVRFSTILCLYIYCIGFSSCGNNKEILPASHLNTQSIEHKTKTSIVAKIKELDHRPVEERIDLYYKLKNEQFELYDFTNEDELTMYGYGHLWSNKTKDAISIFKLIVSEFPNSSNPYDSLGEAYLADGDKKRSLINYEKSLALNPDNFGAEDQIERIKYPERKVETPQEKFVKIFTMNEYKADLDQLGEQLMKIHPAVFKFNSKDNFLHLIESKKKLITENTTFSTFRWHCNEIIASVNCSHTSAGNFFPENDQLPMSLKFPLQVRWTNDQLFVIDPLTNENSVSRKDEIISINDRSVAQIMSDIYKHIPSQGLIETSKKHDFNKWATVLIPNAMGFPKTYSIKIKGNDSLIKLKQAEATHDPLNDTSIEKCEDNLCLEFIDNSKNAVLTVSSFNYYPWNNLNVFQKFMDEGFRKIKDRGIKNLIVDVRFNGGGSPESSIYLLRYLVRESFNYYEKADYDAREGKETQHPFQNAFKGNLYFLIDGNGNSTTGHFMSIVKVLQLGTIIGEELGSNQFCSAGQAVCRLKKTKLVYYVANNTNETMATSLPDEVGILPDHYVTQTIGEYLDKVDAVKNYAFKLIN